MLRMPHLWNGLMNRSFFSTGPGCRWLIGSGLAGLAAVVIGAGVLTEDRQEAASQADTIVVYKSPTCMCCSKWIAHLKAEGFPVEVHNEQRMANIKQGLGIPEGMGSCHTATIAGYVLEGHVPAQDIRRLLAERPAAKGLLVPGMPIGSPGMEQGARVDPYKVLIFDGVGAPKAFAEHGTRKAEQPRG